MNLPFLTDRATGTDPKAKKSSAVADISGMVLKGVAEGGSTTDKSMVTACEP